MSRVTPLPTVHVGKAWRLLLSDFGLSSQGVLRRSGLPGGALDGEGTRISLDEFYLLSEVFAEEANDPELALKIGQVGSVEFFDPAIFAAMCSPDLNTAAKRLGKFKRLVGAFSIDVEILNDVTNISYCCKYRPDVPLNMRLAEIVFLVSFARRATRQNIEPLRVTVPLEVPSIEA